MKTSLGIWAMGPMVTRFNPAGYKPELAGLSTAEYVRTAVAGLEGLIDDYEFHHPQELCDDNLDEVRDALAGHGIYAIASGMHLDNRFARGGLSSPDDAIRAEAVRRDRRVRRLRRAARRADDRLAWDRGLQLPLPDAVRAGLEGADRRHRRGRAETLAEYDQVLLLEHKNSEPAMKIHMGNVGMTLHVIHTLRARGITNVQVNMDWQHLIMNGENLAEYAALLARRGAARPPARQLGLGHVRRRQHGRRDGVHGDARARGRAAPRGLRRPRRAARLRSVSVHRGRRRGRASAACCSGASSTARRRGSTTRRCARRSRARTRSAPTSSCTRRSARRRVSMIARAAVFDTPRGTR